MANRYWVGNGGNYTDFENHWAASSNGTPGTAGGVTAIPGSGDNIYFDANSFNTSGQTVDLLPDAYDRGCLSFTCSGFTEANKPTFAINQSGKVFKVAGTLTLMSTTYMTWSHGSYGALEFNTNSSTFNPQGHTFGQINHYIGSSETLTLGGDLTCSTLYLGRGGFDTDGYNLTIATQLSNSGNFVRSQTFDGSTITVGRNVVFSDTTNLTHSDVGTKYIFTATPANATLTNASTAGTPITLNDVTFDPDGSYTYTLQGNWKFTKLTIAAGATVVFTAGTVQTITGDSVLGDGVTTTTIQSSVANTVATLSIATGKYVWAKKCTITDIVASGDGTGYYSYGSTVDAESTGWTEGSPSTDSLLPKITDTITWTSTFGVGDDLKPMLADAISVVAVSVIAVGGGALSPAGALGNTALFIEYMGASSTTPAGAVAKQTSKPMSAAVTGAGAVAKQTNKTTSASLSPTASTEEQFVSLNYPGQGSITPVGSLAKLTSKLWGGAVTAAGGLAKQITKLAGGGILNPIGSFPITRLIAVGAGALTATGNAVAAIVSVVVSYGGGRLNRGRYSHKR